MKELSIGQLARRSKLAPSALRYYEQIGLLAPVRRIAGRRRYSEDAVERLRVIQMAQRSGFSLKEIVVLMKDLDSGRPSTGWRRMASRRLTELETKASEIERMRGLLREGLECECISLASCRLLA